MKNFTHFLVFVLLAAFCLPANLFGQITQVGVTTTATSSGGNIIVNKPAGIQIDDVMIASFTQSESSSGFDLNFDVNLAGWSEVDGSNLTAFEDPEFRGTLLYRVATAADVSASDYDFDLDNQASGAVGSIIAFRGVDVTGGVDESGGAGGPFDHDPGNINGFATDNSLSTNDITTLYPESAVIMFGFIGENTTTGSNTTIANDWTTAASPGALTELLDEATLNGAASAIGASWAIKTVAGNTGVGSATIVSSLPNGSLMFALKKLFPPVVPDPFVCDGKFFVSYGTGGETRLDSLGFNGVTIDNFLFPTNNTNTFNAIGINPINRFMYAISSTGTLIKIGRNPNPVPPNFHVIEDLGAISPSPSSTVWAGGFDDNGDYYYAYETNFRKITTVELEGSRTSTELPDLNGSGDNEPPASGTFIIDMAISQVTGKLYGVSLGTGATVSSFRIYEIDKTTGALTRLGAPGDNTTGQYPSNGGTDYVAALFFSEGASLYGYREDGQFLDLNLVDPQNSIPSGNGNSYSQADGCACSFGRVYHTLAAPDEICPGPGNLNPEFDLTVTIFNESPDPHAGLLYDLTIGFPAASNRYSFIETPAVIAQRLFDAGLLPTNAAGQVIISSAAPGTDNKIHIDNFQDGAALSTTAFTLMIKLVTLGKPYNSVGMQSIISGLPVLLGSTDQSNDPDTPAPDDPTFITFCGALPVGLTSFNGALRNNETLLNWSVSYETNLAAYVVQRSENAIDFTDIRIILADVDNNSSKQYYATDDLTHVAANILFYRLKIYDKDGSYKYSNVVLIRKDQKKLTGIKVSPNPVARGQFVTLRFEAASKTQVDLSVIDLMGRVVAQQQNSVNAGINSIAIQNIELLNPGMYFIRMNDGNAVQVTRLVIAQ